MVSGLGVFCGIVRLPIPLAAVESQGYHIAMEGTAPYFIPVGIGILKGLLDRTEKYQRTR